MDLADLQNKLRESVSWWAVMQHLVAAWRSRPNPADDPWAGPDELFAQLGELMCTIEDQLVGDQRKSRSAINESRGRGVGFVLRG